MYLHLSATTTYLGTDIPNNSRTYTIWGKLDGKTLLTFYVCATCGA